MSRMTREQKKYWRRSAIQAIACLVLCNGIAWIAAYLVEAI